MKVLVTGADGFVGRYLIESLQNRGYRITAGLLNPVCDFPKYVKTICFDIVDSKQVDEVVSDLQPDCIVHLAAQSMVKAAWQNPVTTLSVNTIGTVNIVNAVCKFSSKTKVITIGSSEEYGIVGKHGRPITEEDCCLPQNPYATSKLAAGQISLQLAMKEHINVIHVRPFNHFGPFQRPGFIVSDFASQIAKIEKGLIEPVIYVGDLSAQRDFTYVQDIIEAYVLLVEKDVETGVYNVCSGKPHTAGEVLDILVSHCKPEVKVRVDKDKMRPSNVPLFIGSAEKLMQATGWKPRRIFEDSLVETLDWWRNQ